MASKFEMRFSVALRRENCEANCDWTASQPTSNSFLWAACHARLLSADNRSSNEHNAQIVSSGLSHSPAISSRNKKHPGLTGPPVRTTTFLPSSACSTARSCLDSISKSTLQNLGAAITCHRRFAQAAVLAGHQILTESSNVAPHRSSRQRHTHPNRKTAGREFRYRPGCLTKQKESGLVQVPRLKPAATGDPFSLTDVPQRRQEPPSHQVPSQKRSFHERHGRLQAVN